MRIASFAEEFHPLLRHGLAGLHEWRTSAKKSVVTI
jgi:hypothetical protein